MASKSLRRLAADHRSLLTAGLPPNYLFAPNADDSDLTSLDVLLAGPTGTPYASGVWRLHLDIPPNYPTAPPTATFRTRLWHPNIDESTGAVCVETLKRDWSSSLKLRDVLVTISCLLIQPNPASALNEAAGKLASEDWDGFCRRAKLMTSIHAAVPSEIANEVREAQSRGEEKEVPSKEKVAPAVLTTGDYGKDSGKLESSAVTKLPQKFTEEEENRQTRGDTVEVESDPESDWIPRPLKSPKGFAAEVSKGNIFGIKGLDTALDFDTPLKKTVAPTSQVLDQDMEDASDPFTLVSPKRSNQHSFTLRTPQATPFAAGLPSISTPDVAKLSHSNPFSTIQLEDRPNPLLKEFSWSWQESEILHDSGTVTDGTSRDEVCKRLASDEFEAKREWEMKRFKKAGYDLAKYNRGDFGPRTGIHRL